VLIPSRDDPSKFDTVELPEMIRFRACAITKDEGGVIEMIDPNGNVLRVTHAVSST